MTRMRGRNAFLDLRRNGVRGRSGAVTVAFAPHGGVDSAHVGYAISRRVGNAVVRNKLRRRLRSALSDLVRSGQATLHGGLYVITPSPGAVALSFPQLGDALQGALRKAALRAEREVAAR